MAEYEDREHFIPLRKSDLIELLLRQPDLPADQRENFAQFCKLVVATYHFEYHKELEELKKKQKDKQRNWRRKESWHWYNQSLFASC